MKDNPLEPGSGKSCSRNGHFFYRRSGDRLPSPQFLASETGDLDRSDWSPGSASRKKIPAGSAAENTRALEIYKNSGQASCKGSMPPSARSTRAKLPTIFFHGQHGPISVLVEERQHDYQATLLACLSADRPTPRTTFSRRHRR